MNYENNKWWAQDIVVIIVFVFSYDKNWVV
jgi:hypothetical protein